MKEVTCMRKQAFFALFLLAMCMFVIIVKVSPAEAADPIEKWKLVYCGSNQILEKIKDIAYGNGTYVAVGGVNKVYYSHDGQKWTSREYTGSSYLQAVTYGQGKFVAVGDRRTTAVSNDGIVWKIKTLESSEYDLYDVVYGNGVFVAAGVSRVTWYDRVLYHSTDGENWQYLADKPTRDSKFYFINNELLMTGRESTARSKDGKTWVYNAGPPPGSVRLAYGNGIYVLTPYAATVLISTDGKTWTKKPTNIGELVGSHIGFSDVVFSNGIFVLQIVSTHPQTKKRDFHILYSVDGQQWKEGGKNSKPGYLLSLIAVDNLIFGFGDYLSIFNCGPFVPPDTPQFLTATAESNRITISWRHNLDASGYRVFRAESLNPLLDKPRHIATLGAAGSYTDTGLDLGKTYYYKVHAFNNYGSSPDSSMVSATTKYDTGSTPELNIPLLGIRLAKPENLKAGPLSQTEIMLNWEDKSNNESGFKIERRTESTAFQWIGVTGPNETSFKDAGLMAGSTYYYRVKAYGEDRDSFYSNEASATTGKPIVIIKPELTISIPDFLLKVPEVIETEDPDPDPDPDPDYTPDNGNGTIVVKFYIDNKNYTVNEQDKVMDTGPIIMEGRTLLPIRFVAEPLGADVGWDGGQQKATVSLGAKEVELWIGQNRAKFNGTYHYIDPSNHNVVPITVPPGRTMLPLRFIAETLGCQVSWDPEIREVTIITFPAL